MSKASVYCKKQVNRYYMCAKLEDAKVEDGEKANLAKF